MAKIIVTGNAVSVVSTLKLDELNLVKKYRPDALALREGEDKKIIFKIFVTSHGEMDATGISFNAANTDGNAVMNEIFDNVPDGDIKDVIAEKYGVGILNLRKLEASLPQVIADIKSERTTIINTINVQ